MEKAVLRYDFDKSTLLCLDKSDNSKKIWIKKLNNITHVSNIIEDNKKYYIVCESGDINGQFLALSKDSGSTKWFIPGKSFMQVIFKGALYLIFIDDNNKYYLLKVRRDNGKTTWHHRVDQDLFEYSFSGNKITLSYSSKKKELLSIRTGKTVKS